MVKHGRYPECTSSVLQALMLFKELNYGYRTKEIEKCTRDAATFIESRQGEDGSWFVRRPHLTYLIENISLLPLQQFITQLVLSQVRHLGRVFHLWGLLFG